MLLPAQRRDSNRVSLISTAVERYLCFPTHYLFPFLPLFFLIFFYFALKILQHFLCLLKNKINVCGNNSRGQSRWSVLLKTAIKTRRIMRQTKHKISVLSSAYIPLSSFAFCSEPLMERKKKVSLTLLVLVDYNSNYHINFKANIAGKPKKDAKITLT